MSADRHGSPLSLTARDGRDVRRRIPPIRRRRPHKRTASVDAKGTTVAEVIDDPGSRHSGLKDRLITDGKLHRFVNIYVDDEDVRFAGGLEAPLGETSTLTILPAVAGGWPALTREQEGIFAGDLGTAAQGIDGQLWA